MLTLQYLSIHAVPDPPPPPPPHIPGARWPGCTCRSKPGPAGSGHGEAQGQSSGSGEHGRRRQTVCGADAPHRARRCPCRPPGCCCRRLAPPLTWNFSSACPSSSCALASSFIIEVKAAFRRSWPTCKHTQGKARRDQARQVRAGGAATAAALQRRDGGCDDPRGGGGGGGGSRTAGTSS